MATRDRNLFAWQAYVITTSIISFGLLVGVFLLWKSYSDLSKRDAELATKLKEADAEAVKWLQRVKRLKSMLGYGTATAEEIDYVKEQLKGDAELDEAEKNYATDMAVFGPNVEKKDYRQFPIYLLDTIRERNTQIIRANQIEQKLTKEKAEVVDRETKAREEAVKKQNQAETDLASERDKHKQLVAKLNAEKDQIQAQFAKFKSDYEAEKAVVTTERDRLAAETKKQAETIQKQADEIRSLRKEDFEEPAGKVINVSEGSRRIWINLGSDDGLREGVNFAVLEDSTLNVADAKIKAEMVVEKIIEPHLAMARVTTPNWTKPVLPGDLVYSPAWRKGRGVGFALVGVMDIDGNGRDDRELIKSIIRRAGGRIDAEVLPSGKRGEGAGMNVNTQFIVLGSDVTVNENSNPEQQKRASEYSKFVLEGKSYGIQQINLNKLMGYLKPKSDERVVPLGSQTRGADFKPESETGVTRESPGVVSEVFRQRLPLNP